jgi:hypothetical protein
VFACVFGFVRGELGAGCTGYDEHVAAAGADWGCIS